eukprot:11777442-Alexandrium_andersonii.AAC.1
MVSSLGTLLRDQALPNADIVESLRVDTDVNMVPGGLGTGGIAVPFEEEHPFLAPQNPTAQQIMEFSVSWFEGFWQRDAQ